MIVIIALDTAWREYYAQIKECGNEDVQVLFKNDLPKEEKIAIEEAAIDLAASELIVASGDSACRAEEFAAWEGKGARFFTFVHPDTYIDNSSKIAEGTFIAKGAIVGAETVIGRNCLVSRYAQISHDNNIADGCTLLEKVTLGGNCKVGAGTSFKSNSVLKEHCTVGSNVTCEVGAVVLGDVEDGLTVYGNPARVKKQ